MTTSYRRKPLPRDSRLDGPRLVLQSSVVALLAEHLPKSVRGVSHENVAYLGGFSIGDIKYATTVVLPAAITAPGGYETDAKSHRAVTQALCSVEYEIVAQVHTHPGKAVYHSDPDDELAFVKGEGFWSIVVPNYAGKGVLPLRQCGFHLYSRGDFRLLTLAAVSNRIRVEQSLLDVRQ